MNKKAGVIGVSVLLVASLVGNGVQYSLYTKQMNEVNANISSVQTQLDEAIGAQSDLQVQLDEALKKQADLQTQLDTTKQELADKQSEYDLIQQENEALQKSLTDKPQTTSATTKQTAPTKPVTPPENNDNDPAFGADIFEGAPDKSDVDAPIITDDSMI